MSDITSLIEYNDTHELYRVDHMKYKAIIFDMDGTIINSEHLWEASSKHILQTKGNLSEEECRAVLPELKGASLHTTCAFIRMKYNTKESVEELIRLKERFAFKNFANFISFIDGFERFHHNLSKLGMKSAIATNATINTLDKTKQHVPLEKYFHNHIYCFEHAGSKPKPKPDVFLHAAQQINTEPEHCIVIEDSAPGIAAAKAANMLCIGINTGNDKQALQEADIIVDHYDEINLSKILS